MIRATADTHAIVWYVQNDPRLSTKASAAFDDALAAGDRIAVSSICLAEIVYLIEKWKIDASTTARIYSRMGTGNLFLEVPVNRRIVASMEAIPRGEIPDMPDRIIAATALFLGVPLISRDGKIRASRVATIW